MLRTCRVRHNADRTACTCLRVTVVITFERMSIKYHRLFVENSPRRGRARAFRRLWQIRYIYYIMYVHPRENPDIRGEFVDTNWPCARGAICCVSFDFAFYLPLRAHRIVHRTDRAESAVTRYRGRYRVSGYETRRYLHLVLFLSLLSDNRRRRVSG